MDLTGYTEAELVALIDEIRAQLAVIQQQEATNEQILRDAAAVDAEISAVMAHATKVEQIIGMPSGQDLPTVEVGVHWLAEALYQVGALSIRAARLAAGRTQTAETLPGV